MLEILGISIKKHNRPNMVFDIKFTQGFIKKEIADLSPILVFLCISIQEKHDSNFQGIIVFKNSIMDSTRFYDFIRKF